MSDVSLLTKKGYLTISLSHVKDGRVFLRRHEGLKEWYSMIKVILRGIKEFSQIIKVRLQGNKGMVKYDKGNINMV